MGESEASDCFSISSSACSTHTLRTLFGLGRMINEPQFVAITAWRKFGKRRRTSHHCYSSRRKPLHFPIKKRKKVLI